MEILIDPNIALYLLGGNKRLAELLDGEIINFSFISELELLAYQNNSSEEQEKINSFLDDYIIIDINHSIKMLTINIRRQSGIKNYPMLLLQQPLVSTQCLCNLQIKISKE